MRMKTQDRPRAVCPRCEYELVPVHAVEGRRRRVVALSCPEPYCDHMQMVTRREARKFGLKATAEEPEERRA